MVSLRKWGKRGTGFPEGWRQGGVCPGGVYGRMFGACGSRIVQNRAVSPRVQRFRGLRRIPD